MTSFVMIVGIPGSGKSTFAKQIGGTVICSDEYREKLFRNVNDQTHNTELFNTMIKDTITLLNEGKDVVYDSTNVSYKKRKSIVSKLKESCKDVEYSCVFMATPYETCIERNSLRERQVDKSTIKRMYLNFNVPYYYEGWDNIFIELDKPHSEYSEQKFMSEMNIPHDNPNHKLSVLEHSILANKKMKSLTNDIVLCNASLWHDLGKPFTKSFLKLNGEISEIAHYYNHHNVGAYESIFYSIAQGQTQSVALYTSAIIMWHMQPFFTESDKSKNKFKNIVGEKIYNDVQIIHNCDRFAH